MRSLVIGLLLLLSIGFYPYLKQSVAQPTATQVSGSALARTAPNKRVAVFGTVTRHYITDKGIRVVNAQADDGSPFTFTEGAAAKKQSLRVAARYYIEGSVTNGLLMADLFKTAPANVDFFTEIRGQASVVRQTSNGNTLATITNKSTGEQFPALFANSLRGIPYTQKHSLYRGYFEDDTFMVQEVE